MAIIKFATSNQKKLQEVQTILPDVIGVAIELPEIQADSIETIVRAKIAEARRCIDGPVLVDDTAFYLDIMQSANGDLGMPGPYIKWFLQSMGNVRLAQLAIDAGNTRATAQTMLAYSPAGDQVHIFEGLVTGHVAMQSGQIDAGWSAVFIPDECTQSLDHIPHAEQQQYNMRMHAVRALKRFLEQ